MGNEPGKNETTKPVEQSNSTVNVIGKLKKSQATYVFSHSLTYSYINSFFILHTYIYQSSISLLTHLLASHIHIAL